MDDILKYFTSPDLGPFAALNPLFSAIMAALWFIALMITVGFIVVGSIKFVSARTRYQSDKMAALGEEIGTPSFVLVLLLCMPVVLAIIIALAKLVQQAP